MFPGRERASAIRRGFRPAACRRPPLAALLLAAAALTGCGERDFVRESYVFGTRVQISVYGPDEARAAPAVDAALRDLDRLHAELHAWQPGPLTRLNAAFAAGRGAPVSPELSELLGWSRWAWQRSDGVFNPAIGGLIETWGFHRDEPAAAVPSGERIRPWLEAKPTPADVRLKGNLAFSVNPAVRLDFGGIAKGWALDRVAQRLKTAGIRHALINIGGNVMALGRHGERPWRVGLQHPRRPEAMLELDLHDGEAIGTSGDYQRYFMAGGRRYAHLIDPRTGRPAERATSATVIAGPARGRGLPGAGLVSDVASKPLFILGPGPAAAAMRRFEVNDWLVVTPDGTVYLSKPMQTRVHWPGRPPKAVVVRQGAG